MVAPPFRKCFHHGMICFLWLLSCLIIHDMNQTSWYVLEETDAFSIIKVRNLQDETGDALGEETNESGKVILAELLICSFSQAKKME